MADRLAADTPWPMREDLQQTLITLVGRSETSEEDQAAERLRAHIDDLAQAEQVKAERDALRLDLADSHRFVRGVLEENISFLQRAEAAEAQLATLRQRLRALKPVEGEPVTNYELWILYLKVFDDLAALLRETEPTA